MGEQKKLKGYLSERKNTEEKQSSTTIVISVYRKGTVFSAKLKL